MWIASPSGKTRNSNAIVTIRATLTISAIGMALSNTISLSHQGRLISSAQATAKPPKIVTIRRPLQASATASGKPSTEITLPSRTTGWLRIVRTTSLAIAASFCKPSSRVCSITLGSGYMKIRKPIAAPVQRSRDQPPTQSRNPIAETKRLKPKSRVPKP